MGAHLRGSTEEASPYHQPGVLTLAVMPICYNIEAGAGVKRESSTHPDCISCSDGCIHEIIRRRKSADDAILQGPSLLSKVVLGQHCPFLGSATSFSSSFCFRGIPS